MDGSAIIKINGEALVSTGSFAKKDDNDLQRLTQTEYLNFIIKDSILNIEVIYIPLEEEYDFDLSMGQTSWSEKKIEENLEDGQDSFALGFYYLAFGIVFLLLFLFYNVIRENLYFAAFCIMASLAFLIDEVAFEIPGNLQAFFFIFSIGKPTVRFFNF